MIIIGIVVAIIMFTLIVIIHELGHFSASRFFGVKVEEFGIGIPPKAKVLAKDKKGTIYTLNWLPLGGFVRLKGENPNEEIDKNDKEAFSNKSYLAKSIILLAGVFFNFLLAIIIFSSLFFIGVKPVGINSQIQTNLDVKLIPTYTQAIKSGLLEKKQGIILNPLKNSIAEKAGIKSGDILLKVNNKNINSAEDLVKIVGKNPKNHITFTIKRNNKIININIIPNSFGKIGTYLSPNIVVNKNFKYKYGLIDSIKYGVLETYNQSLLTIKGIGILIKKIFNPEKPKDRTDAIKNMKGPIGVIDLVANSLSAGIIFIFIIAAIISINLGVFNLLPIPALDGGRFLLISINTFFSKIFGKKAINDNFENLIHLFFFIILIGLSLIIGYNDILNIIK